MPGVLDGAYERWIPAEAAQKVLQTTQASMIDNGAPGGACRFKEIDEPVGVRQEAPLRPRTSLGMLSEDPLEDCRPGTARSADQADAVREPMLGSR